MKKKHLFIFDFTFISILFFTSTSSFAQENNFNWLNITGRWETRSDNKQYYLVESKRVTRDYGNNELVNYNSIINEEFLIAYSVIQYKFEIGTRTASPLEMVVFFATKDFRSYYGFKIKDDGGNGLKLNFHRSSIKDTTLRPHIKLNYTITELATKDIELEYNREYRAEIRVKKNRATLYIDGKKLMEAEAPEDLTSGKIGFSNRNAMLKIADVKVYSGKELVFEDDFSKDSIKRYRVQATTMSKEEYEKQQKGK